MKKKYLKIISTFLIIIMILISGVSIKAEETSSYSDVDSYINNFMSKEKIPGVAVGIIKDNKLVYSKGYGISNNSNEDVTADTNFVLGSLTNSFTAAAVMKLSEQGKIKIDNTVKSYIPDFSLQDDSLASSITVNDLLKHTSGLPDTEIENCPSLEAAVKSLKNFKVSASKTGTHKFSNLNNIILGFLIEKVTNMPYSTYIQNNVFNTLNMKNSFTSVSECPNLAAGYKTFLYSQKAVETKSRADLCSSQYLISNVNDLSKFAITIMNEKNNFVNKNILDSIPEDGTKTSDDKRTYGFGWYYNTEYYTMSGDTEGYYSNILIDKSNKSAIVLLMNSNDLEQFDRETYSIAAKDLHSIVTGKSADYKSSFGRKIINIGFVMEVILILFLVFRMIRFIADVFHDYVDYDKSGKSILIINIFIPLIISGLLYKFFNLSIKDILSAGSDLTIVLFIIPAALLAIGIIKGIVLIIKKISN